jgi:hypothetical protein
VSLELRGPTGDVVTRWGPGADGRLAYDASSNVVGVLFPGAGSEVSAYIGTYRVDEQMGQVSHTVVASNVAGTAGTELVRGFRIDGSRLETESVPDGAGAVTFITWERVG